MSEAHDAPPKLTGLEGNGVTLVRERALAAAVQRGLERLYQLDRVVDVDDYLEEGGGEREALLVREAEDGGLELSLRVPALARREFDVESASDLDPLCQIIEGVSHFVYLTHRAAIDRGTTQLELEVQAEVDKYVILAASLGALDRTRSAHLRERLYESVSFSHAEGTEPGDRYRMANALAARFVNRLEREYVGKRRFRELRAELRRFFRMGQEEKLRVSRAA